VQPKPEQGGYEDDCDPIAEEANPGCLPRAGKVAAITASADRTLNEKAKCEVTREQYDSGQMKKADDCRQLTHGLTEKKNSSSTM
jgi:hypothetical protein